MPMIRKAQSSINKQASYTRSSFFCLSPWPENYKQLLHKDKIYNKHWIISITLIIIATMA
jgi:hypothetical protein